MLASWVACIVCINAQLTRQHANSWRVDWRQQHSSVTYCWHRPHAHTPTRSRHRDDVTLLYLVHCSYVIWRTSKPKLPYVATQLGWYTNHMWARNNGKITPNYATHTAITSDTFSCRNCVLNETFSCTMCGGHSVIRWILQISRIHLKYWRITPMK